MKLAQLLRPPILLLVHCQAFSPPTMLQCIGILVCPAHRRNGWCPGQDVAPWAADVTAALSPEGQLNSLTYRGALLNGSEPAIPAGVLLMQSNLVFQLGC